MSLAKNTVRIGCGSGGADDRREDAIEMVKNGDIEYLCCDRLAERTLANAKIRMLEDPTVGYNKQLEPWFRAVIPEAVKKDVTIVGNFGAANVPAAGAKVAEIARELGHSDLQIATITGDDILRTVEEGELEMTHLLNSEPLDLSKGPLLANAYIGIEPILEALAADADIILGGRIADLSMFLAPMIHEFGWEQEELDSLANGATIAHLLECGMYGTGANLHEPSHLEVPDLDRLALPLAEVNPDGSAVVSKPPETGGIVDEMSIEAQLCHEIHDPKDYKTPDLVVDISGVELEEVGEDQVYVSGATGSPRPDDLKALIGVKNGYLVQIEGGWAGSNSYEKAKVTRDQILKPKLERWEHRDQLIDSRFDVVGVDAIHGSASPEPECNPNEVRLRLAAKVETKTAAQDLISLMKMAQWMSCAGAGGVQTTMQRNITITPTTVPRDIVETDVTIERAGEAVEVVEAIGETAEREEA